MAIKIVRSTFVGLDKFMRLKSSSWYVLCWHIASISHVN